MKGRLVNQDPLRTTVRNLYKDLAAPWLYLEVKSSGGGEAEWGEPSPRLVGVNRRWRSQPTRGQGGHWKIRRRIAGRCGIVIAAGAHQVLRHLLSMLARKLQGIQKIRIHSSTSFRRSQIANQSGTGNKNLNKIILPCLCS
jgi:hypothetical protein